MRLLFLIHNVANGGAERVLSLLVNESSRRGHKVFVLTNPREVTYPLAPDVVVLDAYANISRCSNGGLLKKVLQKVREGVVRYKTLKKTFSVVKPDYTISFLGFFIWQLLLFCRRQKIIISDHTEMGRTISARRDFERRVLPRFFYRHTVLTAADKLFLNNRGNVVVIPNPLTFNPISHEEYKKLFPERRHIVACANVDRYRVKGVDTLIKAFAIAAKENKDWQLHIAGAGSEANKKTLIGIAEAAGVAGRLSFLGYRNDVDSLLKHYAIHVLASRSEGFGMAITEAMACGCVTASFALPGPSAIIDDGVDGVLVENQNVDALAEALAMLMTNDEKRYQYGLAALSSVRRYSLPIVVDQWEKLFKP